MNKILLLILISASLVSCKKEDKYYNLTEDAKDFLVYEEGETFKLKNEATGDIISFQVTAKTLQFEEYNAPSPHYSWGVSGDTYFEVGHISFISNEGCTGEIWVEGYYSDEFTVKINLYECFDGLYFQDYELYGNYEINGTYYEDVFSFNGSRMLYFSKEKGILQIVRFNNEVQYTLIE